MKTPQTSPKRGLFDAGKRRRKERVWLYFAIVASIALHLTATRTLPHFFTAGEASARDALTPARELRVEFEQVEETPVLPFIEVNPDAPQNVPDDLQFDAARDQQAAQTEPPSASDDETPTLEGEDEQATRVVEGSPLPPEPSPPAIVSPEAGETSEDQGTPPALADMPPPPPMPDFYDEAEDEEGMGSLLRESEAEETEEEQGRDTIALNRNPDAEPREPTEEPPGTAEARPQPLPRPRLPSTTSGPLRTMRGSAPQRLELGVSARFSEYGDYLQRMFEAITHQWHLLVNQVESAQTERSTMALIRFELTRYGEVQNMEVVDSTTGTRIATLLCQDAIRSTAPFGNWTEDMVNALSEPETITIRFNYR